MERRRGLTLIELLIAVTVLTFVSSGAIAVFYNQGAEDLDTETRAIYTRIEEAAGRASAGVQGVPWGIRFENPINSASFYSIFSGSVYLTSFRDYTLKPTLEFENPPSGSSVEIVFSEVFATTTGTNSIIVRRKGLPNEKKTITVSEIGRIVIE